MEQQQIVEMVHSYLEGDGILSDPDQVFETIMALTEEGLRRYDYGFYQINLLSVYGNSFGMRAINNLAAACTRARLWAIWLNARHLSGYFNEGRIAMQGWDSHQIERALARGKGLIICTPHVGAYRMLPADLSLLGFDVTMAMDKQSAGCYSKVVSTGQTNAVGRSGHKGVLSICDVERESNSTLILAKLLQRNGIVVFWFDGNLGLDGRLGEVNRCATTFLRQPVAVKTGFARLAAATGASILPVYAPYSSSYQGILRWGALQHLDGSSAACRANSAVEFTTRLYEELEEYVLRYPEQWESMRFLHRWRSIAKKSAADADAQEHKIGTSYRKGQSKEMVLRLPSTKVMCLPYKNRVTLVDVESLSVIQVPRSAEALLNRLCTDEGIRVYDEDSVLGTKGMHSQHSKLLARLRECGMLEAR